MYSIVLNRMCAAAAAVATPTKTDRHAAPKAARQHPPAAETKDKPVMKQTATLPTTAIQDSNALEEHAARQPMQRLISL